MRLSVVIPAYNEEESLGKTLDTVYDAIESVDGDKEVIVVNNNSTDRTVEIAKNHGATVYHQPVQGYGAAYKKGLEEAQGDYIITGDADATYPFEDAKYFVELLDQTDYDFLTTNRFADLEDGSMPIVNHVGNRGLSFLAWVCISLPFKDTLSGMWIFTQRFNDAMNYDIMGDGMSFTQEIKIYADYLDIEAKEIPVTYHPRIGEKKLNPLRDGWDILSKGLMFKRKLRSDETRTVNSSSKP
jgi:glycosyltransferase involved in cell wall biosynthesis